MVEQASNEELKKAIVMNRRKHPEPQALCRLTVPMRKMFCKVPVIRVAVSVM